jgi:hypothetical protein
MPEAGGQVASRGRVGGFEDEDRLDRPYWTARVGTCARNAPDYASRPAFRAQPQDSRLLAFCQSSAFARSVTARSGDGASQLEAERALIEVSDSVESPLAGGTGESARSAGNGPVASPVDSVRACRAALVMIPREHERVTVGCGQRLDVDIREPSGATGRT